jgi:hypothetical protein
MKARCEKVAEAAMPGRVMVIRPGLLVGPMDRSDRFTYWAVRVARGGDVLAPGTGTDPVQLVDVRDLASWMLDCVEGEVTGTFNAISPRYSWNMVEMLSDIKGAFTTDARFTWVDAEFLEEHGVESWTHLPVWVPTVGEYAAFQLASSERAVKAGLRFRPLADTARDTVAWCHEAKGEDYDFERVPEFTASLGVSKEFQLNDLGLLIVRADWSYRDETYNDAYNTPLLETDSYDLIDASIRWRNPGEDWTVTLSGRNLTDEEYLVTGIYGTAFQSFEGSFDRGRQWRLEVRKDF